MATFLRQIVAGPRARHPEANLDLCYVTDNVIATSGPSSSYPQRAYRNPLDDLVKFLDSKHGDRWRIWEFRAEGTGYADHEVYGRIHHYPWPDHHPPPFALIPNIMAGMRDWIKGPGAEPGRVIVVHCKAGKGRSGTVATSYLISEEGWKREDAIERFTARRMRSGFGPGVSIPSQKRWVGYVDWWTKHGKLYVQRPIEIVELHIRGLKSGVKVAIEGYVEEGRKIKTFHVFNRKERLLVDEPKADTDNDIDEGDATIPNGADSTQQAASSKAPNRPPPESSGNSEDFAAATALYKPSQPVILPTSDINIDFERRNKAKYGFTMVTSVAHVWFNAYFEACYAQEKTLQDGEADRSSRAGVDPSNPLKSGVFSIAWDAMDGIRGSARKGTRAFDNLSVVWRAVDATEQATTITAAKLAPPDGKLIEVIQQPAPGQPIPEPGHCKPSVLAKASERLGGLEPPRPKTTGLRSASPASANVSRANSFIDGQTGDKVEEGAKADDDSEKGIKSHDQEGNDYIPTVAEAMEQGVKE